MAKYLIEEKTLTDLANAVRNITGQPGKVNLTKVQNTLDSQMVSITIPANGLGVMWLYAGPSGYNNTFQFPGQDLYITAHRNSFLIANQSVFDNNTFYSHSELRMSDSILYLPGDRDTIILQYSADAPQ